MDDLSRHIFGETVLSLEVPPEKNIRNEIRRKVEDFFSKRLIIPPVSYHDLAEHADELIRLFRWDKSYKAFVMVCSGNAVWRSVVGSIPYHRRMLLLPQCLKN
ncbi:MAG: polyprenyl synthetase, partial [Bacteroidales bacterium]|nr:polyprenyl synthetase [Bacteroidales bacterium]